ncbi:hypothetical protein FUAX_35600 [Fulvitalea axinellae]|uniref:Thioredoxin domain-containing protein n=1 Tax=Fulvitalea axinellae TaxID=1182444 RepID=A0AAU9CLR5_9BACT|nr:hypothetical protein FUAX_35600 [Fulvitalea axinellae]
MRYLLALILFAFCIPAFSQTELNDDNWSEHVLVNNNKIVVLDFYATWCGPCKKMEPIMKELEKKYKGRVEFYKMDVDKNDLDDELKVKSIPTYYFTKNDDVLNKHTGAMSMEKFSEMLDKMLGGEALSGTTAKAKPTPSVSPTEVVDETWHKSVFTNDGKVKVLDFYATWCGPCKKMDPIMAELATKYKGRVDFFKMDIDKNKLDNEVEIKSVPTYIFAKNSEVLYKHVGAMSKADFADLIEKMLSGEIKAEPKEEEKTADKEEPGEFSDEKIKPIWNDYAKLNTLAWHAYEKHDDIQSLLKGIELAQRSIELNENYYNTDTHAALLYKTGNYTKALKVAKRAIDLAKKKGLDYKPTSELIEKIIDKM